MSVPLVTIGIISCNRLEYLKATLESAKECIDYPNIQWIMIDNASVETGLRDYIKSVDWLDEVVLNEERSPQTEHSAAMNKIIELAKGDYVFIWPEDVQFIVKGDWLHDVVEIMSKHEWIGSVVLNALRSSTHQEIWGARRFKYWKKLLVDWKVFMAKFRWQHRLISSKNKIPFRSMGWREEGIVGSGIPSVTRTSVWKELGPWRSPGARAGLVDSSGGGENEMLYRWSRRRWPLHRVVPNLPVAADIISDDQGCKAKVRGEYRYGRYEKAKSGNYFYQIKAQKDFEKNSYADWPISFQKIVSPNGFELPIDANGDMPKGSINEEFKVPVAEGAK